MENVKKTALADSEWRLMHILWKNGPSTLRRIVDEVHADTGWTQHAAISFLKRMAAKGAITITDGEKCKLYSPVLDREKAIKEATSEILKKIYRGDLLTMIDYALQSSNTTDEELDELIWTLRKLRAER